MEALSEKLRLIEDCRTRGDKQIKMIKDRPLWNQFCASLYAIEDAQMAIDAYWREPYPQSKSMQYLMLYGLLQAYFVQQDTAKGILESLTSQILDFKDDYPELYEVRELRNDTIGHPAGRGNARSFVQIVQSSISQSFFSYHLYHKDTQFEPVQKDVDLTVVNVQQEKYILQILDRAIQALDQEFKAYVEGLKVKRLADIFSLLQYTREKILLDAVLGPLMFPRVPEMVGNCKTALNERYISWEEVDSFSYLLRDIDQLIELTMNATEPKIDNTVQHFLTELLFVKLDKLKELCNEVDEYFDAELDAIEER